MANPELIPGYDTSDTNLTAISSSRQLNGFAFKEALPSGELNTFLQQLFNATNKNKNDGVWDWADPTVPTNNTEYNIQSLVSHNGNLYLSLVNTNEVTPGTDNTKWKKIGNFEIDTISDFPTSATDGDMAIVTDLDRGGIFVYDSAEVANDNQGTNFNGWVRQYSGAVDVKWFGAKGDGVTDDTIAIQAAIDSNPNVLVFGEGKTYNFTNSLTISNDVIIYGNGATLNGVGANASVQAAGSIDSEIPVTATVSVGQNTITAANSFSQGDIVIIRDDTDYSFSNHRAYYKDGEFYQVRSSAGTTFDIEGGSKNPYSDTTNLKVSKVNPISVQIDGLTILNDAASNYVLRLKYTKHSLINNCKIQGGVYRAFELAISYSTKIDNSIFYHDATAIGYNYGLSISNSAYTTVANCTIHGTRHGTGIGGADENGAVPNFYTVINNCNITNDVTTGLYSADIHGNSIKAYYNKCFIQGGACLAGENAAYIDCTINLLVDRPAVDYTELVGGEFRLEGNTISTLGNPTGTTTQCIKSSSSAFMEDVTYDCTFVIKNNVFALHSAITRVVQLYTGTGAPIFNLIFESNRYRNDCSNLTDIVWYDNNATNQPQFIEIKDIPIHSTMPSTVKIFTKGGGSFTGCKLTLPGLEREDELAVTTADYRKVVTRSFGFDYGSILPTAVAAIQNSNLIGSRIWFAYVNIPIGTAINIAVTSGDDTVLSAAAFTYKVRTKIGGESLTML